jgi:hypothetical protein
VPASTASACLLGAAPPVAAPRPAANHEKYTPAQHVSLNTLSRRAAVLQRVKSASITVDGELISQIGKGLLVLAAISKDDTEKDVEAMAAKILKAKLWDDVEKDPPARVSVPTSACLPTYADS